MQTKDGHTKVMNLPFRTYDDSQERGERFHISLRLLQEAIKQWGAYNFPDATPTEPFEGLVEELGELAHARLKSRQKIRTDESHEEKEKDALGDIMIFLLHYCALRSIDFEEVLEKTWREVRQRDWINFPDSKGLPPKDE